MVLKREKLTMTLHRSVGSLPIYNAEAIALWFALTHKYTLCIWVWGDSTTLNATLNYWKNDDTIAILVWTLPKDWRKGLTTLKLIVFFPEVVSPNDIQYVR